MIPYVHQDFPKFKYHAKKAARIVHDRQQEAALGADWYDSPAFIPVEEKPEDEKLEVPAAPAAVVAKKAKSTK